MEKKRTASVYVQNATGAKAIIHFSHRYSNDTLEKYESDTVVEDGGNAGPLEVEYTTGMGHTGQDYWFCSAKVLEGEKKGLYSTPGGIGRPDVHCTLHSEDAKQDLIFQVNTSMFYVNKPSSDKQSCRSPMHKAS